MNTPDFSRGGIRGFRWLYYGPGGGDPRSGTHRSCDQYSELESEKSHPMPSLPSHISRYEIKSRIGRGGMGDLYLAADPNIGRLVALKLLNATLAYAELRERFAREARALAALHNANIVKISATGGCQ